MISPPEGPFAIRVIKTDEELMMARTVVRFLGLQPDSAPQEDVRWLTSPRPPAEPGPATRRPEPPSPSDDLFRKLEHTGGRPTTCRSGKYLLDNPLDGLLRRRPDDEILAAVDLLRQLVPELKVGVVNVVNLMKLQPPSEHPHGLSDKDFDALFTVDRPIIFAFHGYPWLIHRLTYRRTNHRNLHVRGYKEEGTTTTPFDMVVLNQMDRFSLVSDVIDRVPGLAARAAYAKQAIRDKLIEHRQYIAEHGADMPDISGWAWNRGGRPPSEPRRPIPRPIPHEACSGALDLSGTSGA